MKTSRTFSARLKSEQIDLLEQLATKDSRTINNYVSKIIVEHVESKRKELEKAKEEESK